MFKGTPGPWIKEVRTSNRGNSTIVAVIPKKYGERVVERVLQLGSISDDDCGVETCCCVEEHANARLIAAAPDLLEALQKVYRLAKQIGLAEDLDFEEFDYMQAALNKALGSEVTHA